VGGVATEVLQDLSSLPSAKERCRSIVCPMILARAVSPTLCATKSATGSFRAVRGLINVLVSLCLRRKAVACFTYNAALV
jgi:hypothetical protein